MAFVIPIAGAFIGGQIFGQIGASVGWLIGSWLYNSMTQQGNDIIDPGAQEMPRFNTAVRGTILPVLFGTNRVPSQIVWQHDFTTIRNETDGGGGGKGGGSAGGKGPTAGTQISYTYKWDILYHLGMVPEPYSIFGGWLGTNKLNGETVLAIQNSTGGDFASYVGLQDQAAIQDKAGLSFEDSFFFQGDGPGLSSATGDANWSEIETDEGYPVRWPHTAYVGFKQMDLGGQPHIPQLTFEIGPGNADVTFDSSFVSGGVGANTDYMASMGNIIKGDDGNYYAISCLQNSGSTLGRVLKWDQGAGTFTNVDSITEAEFLSDIQSIGLDGGYTFGQFMDAAAVVPGTNYFAAFNGAVGSGSNSAFGILLYKINASGVREVVGGARLHANQLNGIPGTLACLGVSGAGTDDDPILMYMLTEYGSVHRPRVLVLPSVNQLIAQTLAYSSGDNIEVNYADINSITGNYFGFAPSYRDYVSFGWFAPKVTIGILGANYYSRFYFFISKADMDYQAASSDPTEAAYVDTLAASYPNGYIGYFDLGLLGTWASTGTSGISLSGPTYAGDDFTDLNASASIFPFSDSGTTRADTTQVAQDYWPCPSFFKITEGSATGAYICIFTKKFTGSDDLYTTGDWTKIKAFLYNPLTAKYGKFASREGSTKDTVTDVGVSEANRYTQDATEKYAIFIEATKDVAIAGGEGYSGTAQDLFYLSKFGTLTVGGGSDVYPPYIIYELLTNNVFGLGIDTSRIDSTSYQKALEYCASQEFKVSVQYRREQPALQVIEELLSLYGGFLVISNGQIAFKVIGYNENTPRTIDNHHLIRDGDQPPVTITKGALQDTFNKVRVNYIDRDLEYRQNQVEEADEVDQDLNGVRMREFPATFVMAEGMARTMAERALWNNLYARDTYSFSMGWKDGDLEPGDLITLVDSFHTALSNGQLARIVNWRENKRGKFDVVAKQEFSYIKTTSTSPLDITSQSANDLIGPVPAPRYFRAYELPAEFQKSDNGAIYVGWCPDAFAAGANLWVSADGTTYNQALDVSPYAIAGTVLTGMPDVPAGYVQENVEVILFPSSGWSTSSPSYDITETLNEAGQAVRAIGGALLWIGSEMIAYENVTLVAQNRYVFGKVFRGWGGTHIHGHSSGDFFFKHGAGIFLQEFNEDRVGNVISYKVQPYNAAGIAMSVSSIDAQTYTILGAHYRPQVAPTPRYVANSVDYRGKTSIYVGSEADIAIDWRDSARKSGYGTAGFGTGDYGRFTQDSLTKSWRVEIVGSGDAIVRSLSVSTATYTYTASDNNTDNGAWRGNVAFKVTPYSESGDAPRTEVVSMELWS